MKKISSIISLSVKAAFFVSIAFLALIFVIISIAMTATTIRYVRIDRAPTNQPLSSWESEDGTISFVVDATNRIRGTININGEVIEFSLSIAPGDLSMQLYDIKIIELEKSNSRHFSSDYQYEDWDCSYKSKKKFVATVRETTFFKEGQKITFYRK